MKNKLMSALCALAIAVSALPAHAAQNQTEIASWSVSAQNKLTAKSAVTESGSLVIGGADSSRDSASFDIGDDITFESGKNYYLKVEYEKDGTGFFFAEYTNTDGETVQSDYAYCDGSEDDGEAIFLLKNPRFNKKAGAVDFKLSSAINRSNTSSYSEDAVKINNISIYTDNTYADAQISVSTGKIGNIFYTGETVSLKTTVVNKLDKSTQLTAKLTVYRIEKDGSKTQVESQSKNISIDALGKYVIDYAPSKCSLYGNYLLEVKVSGGERTANVTEEVEFSRAVYSKNQNPTYGINTHTGNGRGSSEKIFELSRYAGIGLTRETYNWETYEPTKGNKALTGDQKNALADMNDNGLSAQIVIYGNNRAYEQSSDYVTPSNIENYKAYIKSFVCEDSMKNVKNFEIYNEPDIETKKRYDNSDITGDSSKSADEKRGEYYGYMLVNAYDAIKAVRPEANVSALSFCRVTNTTATKNFLKGAASVVKEYYDKNKKLPFDNVSVHPYIGEIPPEGNSSYGSIQEIIENLKSYFNEQVGCSDNYPLAVTEYGWSNREMSEEYAYAARYAGSEHEQAVLNLRAYLVMKAADDEQKNYVYDFMDDGLRKNTQEHNFGMVRNENYRVPYAAKAEYLAVGALNNFTADSTSASCVYNENGAYIVKFEKPNAKVYAVWAQSDKNISYDFGDNVTFYDIYGNALDNDDVTANGAYTASTEPFYAVCGTQTFEKPVRKAHYADICGNLSSGNSGVNVSLTVTEKGVDFGEDMIQSLVYFDQTKTYNGGGFEFRLQNLEHGKVYTAYVTDGKQVLSFDFTDESIPTHLELYSGDTRISSVNLGSLNMADSKIKVVLSDSENAENYSVAACYYNSGKMLLCKTGSGTENGIFVDVSTTESVEFDTVKLFLWDSVSGMKPICNAEILTK